MRLRARPFERRLRRHIRQAIRASPALREERRRITRAHRRSVATFPTLFVLLVMPTPFFGWIAAHAGSVHTVLAVLTLGATAVTSLLASVFATGLRRSADLTVLSFLPVTSSDFYRLRWHKCLLASSWLLYVLALSLACMGLQHGFTLRQWALTSLICVLEWAVLAAAVPALVFAAPRWRYGLTGVALLTAAATLMVAKPDHPDAFRIAWPVLFLSPAGWINYALYAGVFSHSISASVYILAALGLLLVLWRLGARAAKTFSMDTETPLGVVSADEQLSHSRETIGDVAAPTLPAGSLGELQWPQTAWLERIVLRFLSPREKEVAHLMTGGMPRWTAGWKTGLVLLCVSMVCLGIAVCPRWIPLAAGVAAAISMLPATGGSWAGFSVVAAWQTLSMPLYAQYPVSFRELSRTMVKVNLVRLAAALPFVVGYGTALGSALSTGIAKGAYQGMLAWYILCALQPFLVGLQLIGRTSAAGRITWRNALGFLPLIVIIISGVAAAIALFWCNPRPGWVPLGVASLMAAVSWLALVIERFIYEHCKVDLLWKQGAQ